MTATTAMTHRIVDVSASGAYAVEVVGESAYQDELEAICGGRTREGFRLETEAYLVPEDNNRFDAQAVAVFIDGHPVGYLDRALARLWRRHLRRYAGGLVVCRCRAIIVGAGSVGGTLGTSGSGSIWGHEARPA
jgi:hypothetical protein